jgi:hypothetical protein
MFAPSSGSTISHQIIMDAQQAITRLETSVPMQRSGSVAGMLQAVIDKGVTAENVAAVEQIEKLYEHMQAKDAERDFAVAFNAMQSEIKGVKATKPVPNRDGTVRYRFAPYEEIMEQVRPMLEKHGFSVAFSTDYAEGRLVKSCTLRHVNGHSQTNKFAVRIGSGPPNASESQADGAASTYAKRFALCDALNIIIETDTDADPRSLGAAITTEQAEELQRRVIESESNEPAFLKFCGVAPSNPPTLADYQKITANRYDAADEMLRRKEARGR